jgi:hypothetical protein
MALQSERKDDAIPQPEQRRNQSVLDATWNIQRRRRKESERKWHRCMLEEHEEIIQ